MNDETPEHRVTLVGGPLDGWPIVVRGRLPEELRLPYSREMLELASRSPAPESREEWGQVHFPLESDADGVAIYRPSDQSETLRPVYRFANNRDSETADA